MIRVLIVAVIWLISIKFYLDYLEETDDRKR